MTHFMIPCKDLYIILTEKQVLPDFQRSKSITTTLFVFLDKSQIFLTD